jgi:hypothetical protein
MKMELEVLGMLVLWAHEVKFARLTVWRSGEDSIMMVGSGRT